MSENWTAREFLAVLSDALRKQSEQIDDLLIADAEPTSDFVEGVIKEAERLSEYANQNLWQFVPDLSAEWKAE